MQLSWSLCPVHDRRDVAVYCYSLRSSAIPEHPVYGSRAEAYRRSCPWQVVAVQLRAGHQHTAVCVGSLPCSSDEERTATGKQAARKEFIIVASYCEHDSDDGSGARILRSV